MPEILIPLTFDDLPVKPPLVGRPKVSEDLQQTVALLVGWDKSTRRLVSVSPTGVLHIASPPVKGSINLVADKNGYTWNGGDILTSEVMLRTHRECIDGIWFNVGAPAGVDIGYYLDSEEVAVFSINNLKSLHIYVVKDTQKVFMLYTK